MNSKQEVQYRKDDLVGIRKARFASFVLLLVCFAAMLVILVLSAGNTQAFAAAAVVIVVLVVVWWFVYKGLLFSEAEFFLSLAKELRSKNRRLRTLESAVRQIGDGVVIVADDGEFILVNETAKHLLAAFEDELDGPGYDELAAGFNEKLQRASILAAAKEGRPPERIEKGGLHYKVGYITLPFEKDRGPAAIAVISDVTESTKVEEMQTAFVANVSHELKTPLASVSSAAETLINGLVDDPEKEEEFLGIIMSEAQRMAKLIRSLLTYTQADYMKDKGASMETEESELVSLVKMSMKKLVMTADKKALSLTQMFPDDLNVPIEMNRDNIEQVLQNVLDNAIKYTEEKGRIDVDIIPGQNSVQIIISDNGIGIPEEDVAHVFERFWRVDKARTGNSGGTGLGLAISKQIVDAHGGAISLESKAGRGTTVTINLPTGNIPAAKLRGTPGID